MGLPRKWERAEGRIEHISPTPDWIRRKKAGELSSAAYRTLYQGRLADHLEAGELVPGTLRAKLWSSKAHFLQPHVSGSIIVQHNDTVWCACGRDKAYQGRCHLSWAVPFLVNSGWRVQMFDRTFPELTVPQLTLFQTKE